ncbi:hypothetical protein KBA41_10120 [Candidatus Ozemobacteraceae bacterium]|nr:hypothetical protein [Candidatus Ozemobacteraceae bacterium]
MPLQRLKNALFFVALSILFPIVSFAQAPSLAPSDTCYITVHTEFGNETFTVIRDGRIEEQFYFVPARPHVAVETRNGKSVPVFQLLTYQRKSEESKLVQGGVLQFSVQMGISEKTETALLDKIRGRFPLADKEKKHRLSPIPMKSAAISMYDLGGKMMDSAPIKEGIAPIFGNQQYPFQLHLTDLGADTLEALCSGRGGVPVIVTYTFLGMTEPGGFKVEVNWDACFKHFSADAKLRANVGYKMLGANLGADLSTIREKMISNGMIKVTSLSNEAMTPERLDAAMTPILQMITKELFDGIKAPAAIPPASAKEIAPPEGAKEASPGVVDGGTKKSSASSGATTAAAGAAGEAASTAVAAAVPGVGTLMKVVDVILSTDFKVGASFALKDVKLVRKGTMTYTFDRQAIVERKTSFGGPIGIGSFDKKIRDTCITVLPPGNWEAAYFMLPPVGDPAKLGFKQLNLSVLATCDDVAISGMKMEAAIFKATTGFWQDKSGNECLTFLFPLKSIYDSPDYKKDSTKFKFRIQLEVIPVAGASIKVTSELPMFDGDLAMAPPTELLQPVSISAECVSFGPQDDEIFFVKGTLKANQYGIPFKLTENLPTQGFLIPRDAREVKLTGMQFFSKKGKKIDWRFNNKELHDRYPDLDIMLFDSDWQEKPAAESLEPMP